MKEDIATIPLMDAFGANDECPFCYLERAAEQHAISFRKKFTPADVEGIISSSSVENKGNAARR